MIAVFLCFLSRLGDHFAYPLFSEWCFSIPKSCTVKCFYCLSNGFSPLFAVSWIQDLKDMVRRVSDVTYANAHADRRNEG